MDLANLRFLVVCILQAGNNVRLGRCFLCASRGRGFVQDLRGAGGEVCARISAGAANRKKSAVATASGFANRFLSICVLFKSGATTPGCNIARDRSVRARQIYHKRQLNLFRPVADEPPAGRFAFAGKMDAGGNLSAICAADSVGAVGDAPGRVLSETQTPSR